MARITVEQKALTDPRFELLGTLMGSNRHEAVGRMLLVWNECQERESYYLPGHLVRAIFGGKPNSARWLVQSDLAAWKRKPQGVLETQKGKPQPGHEGVLRIKGTAGRIEWLARKRENAKENGRRGGRPTVNKSRTEKEPTLVSSGLRAETPPAPAPAPAPAQEDKKEPPNPPQSRGADCVFETLAEVCGLDPSLPSVNRTLTKKTAELLAATPPYTPEEVREFGRRFWMLCPYAREKRERPTPAEVAKWIGLLRANKRAASKRHKPAPTPAPSESKRPKPWVPLTELERLSPEERARRLNEDKTPDVIGQVLSTIGKLPE